MQLPSYCRSVFIGCHANTYLCSMEKERGDGLMEIHTVEICRMERGMDMVFIPTFMEVDMKVLLWMIIDMEKECSTFQTEMCSVGRGVKGAGKELDI